MKSPIFKRTLRYYFIRLFPRKEEGTDVAYSIALGVFVGILPTIGVAVLLTIFFATLFRLPKIPGVVASFIAIPPTLFLFFYPLGYYTGLLILDPAGLNFSFLGEIEKLSMNNFWEIIHHLWNVARPQLLAFLLGITIVAFFFAAFFFLISNQIMKFQRLRYLKFKAQRKTSFIKKFTRKRKSGVPMIYPFKALRPKPVLAKEVASVPYDVVNREEATVIAAANPNSFIHVVRPEVDLHESVSDHDEEVYQTGKKNLDRLIRDKILIQEDSERFFLYRQQMGSHVQNGLVCCVHADDYFADRIKKHEFTREEKEKDRIAHVMELNANTGPVFLTFRSEGHLSEVMATVGKQEALYDFEAEDGIRHTVFRLAEELNESIRRSFASLDTLYIADGHHRSAAGAKAAREKAKNNPRHTGDEEYNRFLAIVFPHDELQILGYNRLVHDLNGQKAEDILEKIRLVATVEPLETAREPAGLHEVTMYLLNSWYSIVFNKSLYEDQDVVGRLDVSLLQENILTPLLGIGNPRVDRRIDFVGGIRGVSELEGRVSNGQDAIAFAMYPTSVEELMEIADEGRTMPPKSTWFEPKLRSGLLVHLLD